MKIKQLSSVFITSFTSLVREGRFARKLLWKHGRAVIAFGVINELQELIQKIFKIALIGTIFSLFQESTLLDLLKEYWIVALTVFGVYSVLEKYIQAQQSFAREKAAMIIDREIKQMIWEKNTSTGIGIRFSSAFRQKLRSARRCNSYDIRSVGMWPIEASSTVLSSVIFFLGLAWLSWKIGLLFVGTAIVVAAGSVWIARWVRDKEMALQEDEDKASEYHPASLKIDSSLLGISEFLFHRSKELYANLLTEQLGFRRKAMMYGTLIGGLIFVAVGTELYVMREALFQNMSLARLGITISTMAMSVGSFVQMARALFGDQSSIQDISELQGFLEYPDEEKNRANGSFEMHPTDIVRAINIDFSYPNIENAPQILRDINLTFEPGEAVVIVGSNGSGKTTLGKVIANVYRPTAGNVLYGSVAVSTYTTRSALEHVMMIPQSGGLPDLKLCESLFGRIALAGMSDSEKRNYFKAIELSGAREVLDKLPDGIHTQIGTGYKGGTNISGGEEQRLRLAAFFYRALQGNVRMIIADEPSRHLDPSVRARVYGSLVSMARDEGKIVVVISHDAELEKFDRVITLDRGKVLKDHRGQEEISRAIPSISRHLAGDSTAANAKE